MIKEQIAPHNLRIEECFLGSILIDKDALMKVSDIVHPDDFYKTSHGDIYESMLYLSTNRDPIDIETLSNRLIEKSLLEKIGGRSYLISLTGTVPTAAHIESYAYTIQKKIHLTKTFENWQ